MGAGLVFLYNAAGQIIGTVRDNEWEDWTSQDPAFDGDDWPETIVCLLFIPERWKNWYYLSQIDRL